ncbi:PREDICTED: uncharacterized protein LOC105571198 [Vollenhovia emeryi]|uniref:uncharacterized protein LOC105571198 n=1 Tax=Vollenhovia emeryi TaxID=411798 RepID=UPI0005F4A67A|nr:PREDICTED: uncharacterized protein LOC105571198 [Vollenhovia emeryi]
MTDTNNNKASEAGDLVPASGEINSAAYVAKARRGDAGVCAKRVLRTPSQRKRWDRPDQVLASTSGETHTAERGCEARSAGGSQVLRESPEHMWDPVPIRDTEPLTIQGEINAVMSCPVCLESGQNIDCLGAKQLNDHISKEHPTISVRWMCESCHKILPKIHAWRCHIPKCKGEIDNTQRAHKCLECPRTFDTASGLSQHERHAHPKSRNAKRAELAEKPTERAGRKLTVWTEEELERLEQLSAEFRESKNINIKLMEFFPDKTNKQISDARRRKVRRAPPRSPINEHAENENSEGENAETEAIHALPAQHDTETQRHEAIDEPETTSSVWKDLIKEMINKEQTVPSRWTAMTAILVALANKDSVNKEVERLCDDLAKELNDQKCESKQPREINRRKSKARPPNRTERRRFAFARCQELINKCPKKLADAVTANDLSLL